MRDTSRGGVSILSVLGLIFIVLKILKIISWSWVWVLAPYWGGLIIGVILICAAEIIKYVSRNRTKKQKKERRRNE